MTNQEQYELLCEKANKYDRLVGVLDTIRAKLEECHCDVIYGEYDQGLNYGLYLATQIIDRYRKE